MSSGRQFDLDEGKSKRKGRESRLQRRAQVTIPGRGDTAAAAGEESFASAGYSDT